MANDLGKALTAFSGAIVSQNNTEGVPQGAMPLSEANGLNEGLLGLTYDIGTAPVSFAKGTTDVPPVQALSSLPTE